MKDMIILIKSFLIVMFVIGFFHIWNIKRIPDIVYVPWLPYPRRAMTIPPFGIFAIDDYKNAPPWFKNHEDIHWEQYQRLGLWKFYITYYRELLLYGYFENALEVEARARGGVGRPQGLITISY